MLCQIQDAHYNGVTWVSSLITRFMGPTWGPSGADRTQVGHMLALLTLLFGMASQITNNSAACANFSQKFCIVGPLRGDPQVTGTSYKEIIPMTWCPHENYQHVLVKRPVGICIPIYKTTCCGISTLGAMYWHDDWLEIGIIYFKKIPLKTSPQNAGHM